MATQYATVEVFILVDDAGDAVATCDEGALAELYEEKVQPVADAGGVRRVKVTVRVPLPTVLEAAAELVEDAAGAEAAAA